MSGASPSLDALEALVPFLRARRRRPEPGDLLAADLAADPDLLASVIRDSAEGRGSDDLQVLASLWWQGYAYRTAGTALAAWVVAGAAPDPSAAVGAGVGVTRSRPSSCVVGAEAAEVEDLDLLLARIFADHLDLVAGSLRARHAIGERLVWGNAAASVASCLGAVACAEGVAAEVAGRIDHVTVALPHALADLGRWVVPHRDYHRTTCCLWWKTTASAGAYCEDCSLR